MPRPRERSTARRGHLLSGPGDARCDQRCRSRLSLVVSRKPPRLDAATAHDEPLPGCRTSGPGRVASEQLAHQVLRRLRAGRDSPRAPWRLSTNFHQALNNRLEEADLILADRSVIPSLVLGTLKQALHVFRAHFLSVHQLAGERPKRR